MKKATPNYPVSLKKHTNPFYSLNDISAFSQGFAYYHNREFPILMHSHNYYELNIIISGTCRHYVKNINHPAKAGDMFMIPPYIEHGYWSNNENVKLFHLVIKNDLLEKYKIQLGKYPGIKILFEVEPQIRQAFNNLSLNMNIPEKSMNGFINDFEELIAIDKEKNEDDGVMFELKTVCLLCKLAKIISQNYATTNDRHDKTADSIILKTTQYMEKNYFSKITVDDLSKIVNMSTPNFFRYFKKVFNTSPIEYLTKIRISHATSMLTSTDKSISFISQECGFFDQSHFSHVFKQLTNMRPKEFRQKAQNKTDDRST